MEWKGILGSREYVQIPGRALCVQRALGCGPGIVRNITSEAGDRWVARGLG